MSTIIVGLYFNTRDAYDAAHALRGQDIQGSNVQLRELEAVLPGQPRDIDRTLMVAVHPGRPGDIVIAAEILSRFHPWRVVRVAATWRHGEWIDFSPEMLYAEVGEWSDDIPNRTTHRRSG